MLRRTNCATHLPCPLSDLITQFNSLENHVKKNSATAASSKPLGLGICILAGGLSSRMGRKKERLKLGRRTLLQIIRATAASTGWPVRVLRKDLLQRCGPIGGVYTGLTTSQADAELFLACDMPFVSSQLIQNLCAKLGKTHNAVFTLVGGRAGFPFVIRTTALALVERQMVAGQFSMQALAGKLRAKRVHLSKARSGEVFNINTLADWRTAGKRFKHPGGCD